MSKAIEIIDLRKTYQRHFWTPVQTVLKGLNLEVESGQIFGFLGPNGAGKTTTIKTMMGIVKPSRGEVLILGQNPWDIGPKQRVGFLPESPYFYDYLTGREFLIFCGRLFDGKVICLKERIGELLDLVKMTDAADLQMRKYSKGMLQRIGLAQALINDPELVVLDEPLTGLDPLGRKEFKDIILDLRSGGKTVFFSSHILADAETVCDRVAIINKGKVLKVGRLDELLDAKLDSVELVCRNLPAEAKSRIERLTSHWAANGDDLVLNFPDLDSADRAVREAVAAGGRIVSLNPIKESLEEYFTREVTKDG